MERIRVDVEEVIDILNRRKKINSLDLASIDFYRNGVKVEVDQEKVKDWDFIGLTNVCFVELEIIQEPHSDHEAGHSNSST